MNALKDLECNLHNRNRGELYKLQLPSINNIKKVDKTVTSCKTHCRTVNAFLCYQSDVQAKQRQSPQPRNKGVL